jgi:predicted dehydrogenase
VKREGDDMTVGATAIGVGDPAGPFKQEFAHFIECVSEGKRPLTDGHSGMRVVRILEAATQSLKRDGVAIELGTQD